MHEGLHNRRHSQHQQYPAHREERPTEENENLLTEGLLANEEQGTPSKPYHYGSSSSSVAASTTDGTSGAAGASSTATTASVATATTKFLFTAKCGILDILPNTFSVRVFGDVVTPNEYSRLQRFHEACVMPFDQENVRHVELLAELWEHCSSRDGALHIFADREPSTSIASAAGRRATETGSGGRRCDLAADATPKLDTSSVPKVWGNQQREDEAHQQPSEIGDNIGSSITIASLVSDRWKSYGFQGTNPATDFRGAGILALRNLLFIATSHQDAFARYLHACHTDDFPFAIAAINVTMWLMNLLHLTHGRLTCLQTTQKNDTYSANQARSRLAKMIAGAATYAHSDDNEDIRKMEAVFDDAFSVALSLLFHEWEILERKNLMEFNSVIKRAEKRLETLLRAVKTRAELLQGMVRMV